MLACLRFSPLHIVFVTSIAASTLSVLAQNASPANLSATEPHPASYGNLPLSFEVNQGQIDSRVQFLSRGSGYAIFLTGDGAVLALGSSERCSLSKMGAGMRAATPQASPGKIPAKTQPELQRAPCAGGSDSAPDVVRMTLAGAKQSGHLAKPGGEEELPGKVNYFLGNDPTRWRADLPTYAKVRYSGVYPGVDLVYYGNRRQLEYDFVVAPGADASRIQLRFTAAKQPRIDANGDLVLNGSQGQAVFHKPLIYQNYAGSRRSIQGNFRMLAKDTVGFTLGRYDRTRPLIIDPVLVYSTYLGGSGTNGNGDQGNGIAVDSAGNAYVVGTTYSTNFPVTSDPFQGVNNAALAGHGSTVFVTKLNAAGTALVYSTYLGGSGSSSGGDFGYGIALDSSNNAYVTGATFSTDFPTTCGAFHPTNRSTTKGASTAFVAKLTPTGEGLVYSTYLGGEGNLATPPHGDVSEAVAVDANGDAFVTGYTWSADFPVTDGALQTNFLGSPTISNAFVSELNRTGTALVYSTYLGGSGSNGNGDYGNGISLDSSGDAYVAGGTSSSNFPVTSGVLQSSLTGSSNAFVTELNPTGTDEIYSTYLGGTGTDSAQAIAIDSKDFIYIAGYTTSSDFPLTAGVLEGTNLLFVHNLASYGTLTFLAKLSLDGSELEYATYVEGHDTSALALAVDGAGNAYLAGNVSRVGSGEFGGFQATPDALSLPASAAFAGYLVKLDSAAEVLNFATILAGTSNDVAIGLALDSSGNAYVTGHTASDDFPTTNGAFQMTNNASANGGNAFVSKFALAGEDNQTTYPALPVGGVPTSLSIDYENLEPGDSYQLDVGVTLNSAVPGPPPSGTVTLNYCGAENSGPDAVPGTWSGVSGVMDILVYDAECGPSWGASYSGDAIYQPSTVTGTAQTPPCYPDCGPYSYWGSARKVHTKPSADTPASLPDSNANSDISMPGKTIISLAKFAPPPVSQDENEQLSSIASTPETEASPACIASSEPPLTVTLHPAQRIYGAANPTFVYAITGLISGQTVIVTPQTTATVKSSVGIYPVTATVTGADAANYTVTVVGTTLEVSKAALHIVAKTVNSTYGQTPPQPTAYTLTGFVNGDTASVVTGAPVLTTTVTAATPVGFYPIGVAVGTLSATNYAFETTASGMGVVAVYKAPLTIIASSEAVTYGQTPAPPTAYKLTGFLNGDTASVVTGAPVLTTTVTSKTPVGFYRIGVAVGTLTATNYDFKTTSNGMGAVGVYKAPLEITVNDLTMTEGSAVPNLTYTLTGFVNGDTAATAVTGTAILSTTATSSSPPGNYPITFSKGMLAAQNYALDGGGNGVLKVLP